MNVVYTMCTCLPKIICSMEEHLCKILGQIRIVCWLAKLLFEQTTWSGIWWTSCNNCGQSIMLVMYTTCCSTGLYDVVKCDWFLECLVSWVYIYMYNANMPSIRGFLSQMNSQQENVYHFFHLICTILHLSLLQSFLNVMTRYLSHALICTLMSNIV